MNIILIGMPASGKSCMGRAISKSLKMKKLDVDRVIEQKTNRKLQDIINEDGLDVFMRIEEEVLSSIDGDNLVISTGGSAVYYPAAMEHLQKIGIVVYLYATLDTIVDRLGDFSKRGVVLRNGQTISDLYNERCELYKKYAHITIDCQETDYNKCRDRAIAAIRLYNQQK